MIPTPWVALVIALGCYRVTRLVGWDDFPLALRIRRRLTGETVHHNTTQAAGPIYRWRRPMLAHFLSCPFCQGFWVCLIAYGAWLLVPRWTVYALAPFALSAFVGLVAKNLDP